MRNDQLAVLLRDFAKRALQWAVELDRAAHDADVGLRAAMDVLGGNDATFPHTSATSATTISLDEHRNMANALRTEHGLTPTTYGNVYTGDTPQERRAYESVPVSVSDVNAGRVVGVTSEPDTTKTYFGCPGVGEPGDATLYVAAHSAVWHLTERGPWPGALCASCYELVQRAKRMVGRR